MREPLFSYGGKDEDLNQWPLVTWWHFICCCALISVYVLQGKVLFVLVVAEMEH